MNNCKDCPRRCREKSFCNKQENIFRVAKVMRHFFEEPILCPKDKGSGAVFFSNCSLKCVFCQNYQISHLGQGRNLNENDLIKIFKKIENSGVANLNLVTPTHYTNELISVLKKCKLKIPIVWNCSGYELEENIEKLCEVVDIFLFDCKYYSEFYSTKYSKAPNYYEVCLKAIQKARKLIPNDIIVDGVMKKGIIVRHLVLPGLCEDSIKIFENIKNSLGNNLIISLMSQYVPFYKAKEFDELNTFLKPIEYKKVVAHIKNLGFTNGYIQDFQSASKDYTPDFSDDKFWEL